MERAPLDASQVANHILRKFFEGNMEITPLKLQNIIYIVYGYYLIITKKRLFDEPILAWDLGPVVPSIYYFYKGKSNKICAVYACELKSERNIFF